MKKLNAHTYKAMKKIHDQLVGLKKEVEAKLIETPDDSDLKERRTELSNLLYIAAGWIDNPPKTSIDIKKFMEVKEKLTQRVREMIKENL